MNILSGLCVSIAAVLKMSLCFVILCIALPQATISRPTRYVSNYFNTVHGNRTERITTGYHTKQDAVWLTDVTRCMFYNKSIPVHPQRVDTHCETILVDDNKGDMYSLPNYFTETYDGKLQPLEHLARTQVFRQIHQKHKNATNDRLGCSFNVTQFKGGRTRYGTHVADWRPKPELITAQYKIVLSVGSDGLAVAKLELIAYFPTVGTPTFDINSLRDWEAQRRDRFRVKKEAIGIDELKRICVDYMAYPKQRSLDWQPIGKWFFEDSDEIRDNIMRLVHPVTNTRSGRVGYGWRREVLEIRIHMPNDSDWPIIYEDSNDHAKWMKERLSSIREKVGEIHGLDYMF